MNKSFGVCRFWLLYVWRLWVWVCGCGHTREEKRKRERLRKKGARVERVFAFIPFGALVPY